MLSRHSDPFCKWTTSHPTESRQVRTGPQSMGTSVYRSLLLSTRGFSVSDQIRKFTDVGKVVVALHKTKHIPKKVKDFSLGLEIITEMSSLWRIQSGTYTEPAEHCRSLTYAKGGL
ncbi:hypothetical protein AOLI_G00283450 [Acnodon oligacanthus]